MAFVPLPSQRFGTGAIIAGFAAVFSCSTALAEVEVSIYQPSDEVEKAAQAMLDKHCARCHQAGKLVNKKKPSKGFGEVMQLDKLAANPDYIVPGNPEGSKLFSTIVNQNMPYDVYQEPDFENAPAAPKPEELQALRTWIEQIGDKQLASCTTEEIYSPAKLVDLMYADLSKLPDHERANTRYVSLAHLATACASADEMKVYRQGTIKLLNSLSLNSDVLPGQYIDKENMVIRFNLDQIKMAPETWEHIISLYPYAVKPANSQYDFLAQTTYTKVPYVRADWLAFFASRPPLYEKILGLSDTFQGLQKQLGLDTLDNIRRYQVARAGFKESGVSQHNRLIERHTISTGAFWTSYDFGGTKTRQNLLEFPLGPQGAFKGTGYGEDFAFHEDGGESIFNLPNGFQAYYLNSADGKYLEKGPTNIVRDPDRVDLAVTNGISCMGCHDQGMKNATDDVGPHIAATKVLPVEAREAVKAIYPEKPEFDKLIEKDRSRFITAMKQAGLDPSLKNGTEEPVNALSNRYERDVDLLSAASEFGVSKEDVLKYMHGAGHIGNSFSAQLEQGTVQRDTFEKEFGGLVENVIEAVFIPPHAGVPGYKEVKNNEYAEPVPDKPGKEYDGKHALSITLYADNAQPKVGDRPLFTVRTDYDCHLTLINVDKKKEGTVIFPNGFERDNLIKGGRDFTFPPSDAKYDFKYLDKGTETVIAICDTSGKATAGIEHDYDVSEFTGLGQGEDATRKIDVVKREEKKKAKPGVQAYSGVARTAIKIKVH